jgi:hypothetical protein
VRIDFEDVWVVFPGIADSLEGRSPSQGFEMFAKVIGRDEG